MVHGNFINVVREPLQEMAQMHPLSRVTGIDLKTIFPPTNCPSNCTFVTGDILDETCLPVGTFGFIHQRLLNRHLHASRWKRHIVFLNQLLVQGGQIELLDALCEFTQVGQYGVQVNRWFRQALPLLGIDTNLENNLQLYLQAEHFAHIYVNKIQVPLGTWDHAADTNWSLNEWMTVLDGVHELVDECSRIGGYEWEQWKKNWIDEIDERRTCWQLLVVTARKGPSPTQA